MYVLRIILILFNVRRRWRRVCVIHYYLSSLSSSQRFILNSEPRSGYMSRLRSLLGATAIFGYAVNRSRYLISRSEEEVEEVNRCTSSLFTEDDMECWRKYKLLRPDVVHCFVFSKFTHTHTHQINSKLILCIHIHIVTALCLQLVAYHFTYWLNLLNARTISGFEISTGADQIISLQARYTGVTESGWGGR